tara:strand:- start:89 stop:1603 length:1515 start_codon:yes stop_codon:yes gene_type:complete
MASNITDLTTLVKTNVDSNEYLYAQNSVSKLSTKLAVETLFPSISTAGTSSETIYTSSTLTSKNQIVFKGIKSGDTDLLTVATTSNNIVLTALEAGIDLSLCNNATSGFVTGVDFTGTVTGECPVTKGGTGLATIAKGALLYASAADTLAATSPMTTNGQLLIGNATNGYPSVTTLTAGAGMTITNGAGTITLAASHTTSEANIDMRNAAGSTTYNIDLHSGTGWLSGTGTDEGITVDGDGKVFMGEDTPTAHFDEGLNLKGGIRFSNTDAVTVKPNATTSDTAGQPVTIESGSSAGGAAGNLNITGGTSSSGGAGGTITLTAGRDTSGSSDGTIILKTYTGGTATAAITIGAEGQDVTIDTGNIIMSSKGIFMRNSSYPDVIKYQGAPATTDDGATAISAANILTGIVECTPTSDISKTTDTASNLISGLNLGSNGDSFDWSFINLTTDGADAVTITGGTGVTLVGRMVIMAQDAAEDAIAEGVARFRIRRTGASAVTMYRIG